MTNSVISHPALGEVVIVPRSTARRFIARWKAGRVHLTVPPASSRAAISSALGSLAPRLLAVRPEPALAPLQGSRIELPDLTLEFVSSADIPPQGVKAFPALPVTRILIGAELDTSLPSHRAIVGRVADRVLHHFAPSLLLPRARQIAASLGLAPASWSISRGANVLGTCSATGHIRLSARVLFLPLPLRDYIICHELAHLTEMNHSPRFHALCNAYCHGRATELRAALRAFRFPL